MSDNPVVLQPVAVTEDLAKAVAGAIDPADVRAAILAEATKQTNARAEAQAAADAQAAAEKAAADAAAKAAAAVPQSFTCTENIGGKELTFEAESQGELDRMVANAYRVAFAVKSPEVATAEPVVDVLKQEADAAAKAAADAAAKAELELKFRRGEIPVDEYLTQSGAINRFLEKEGVSIDALKATVSQNQNTQFEKSWAEATEEFLHSAAGADWPGGDKNRELIGMKLASMNLIDAKDKVGALAAAYADMKKSGMVFTNDGSAQVTAGDSAAKVAAEAAAAKAAADAVTAKAAADAVAAKAVVDAAKLTPKTSSSFFGASSGVGAALTTAATASPNKVEVPKDATPEEILEAWKAAQLANGKNPNDAFNETFANRR
jgi:hypothetical protein